MKNLHIIPTDKPSRLCIDNSCDELNYCDVEGLNSKHITNQHIYITNDEEIKEGDYFWKARFNMIFKAEYTPHKGCEKVILTTDPDLIKDGVQAIDDKFLEWFVKNPSCEEVDVMTDAFTVKEMSMLPLGTRNLKYKIIIPQEEPKQFIDCKCTNALEAENCTRNCGHGEEPKQETLEEAALNYSQKYSQKVGRKYGFMDGVEWQSERSYTKEDIENIWNEFVKETPPINNGASSDFLVYLKQFKKK